MEDIIIEIYSILNFTQRYCIAMYINFLYQDCKAALTFDHR